MLKGAAGLFPVVRSQQLISGSQACGKFQTNVPNQGSTFGHPRPLPAGSSICLGNIQQQQSQGPEVEVSWGQAPAHWGTASLPCHLQPRPVKTPRRRVWREKREHLALPQV